MTREIARAAGRLDLAGRRVLVATSGGLDSTALARALWELAPAGRPSLCLGHVNHGLRGADSDADEAAARELAAELDVEFAVRRIDPRAPRRGGPSASRPTLQEAARELRYAALYAMADGHGAEWIATAHHADDQAETVLLRLLRGTGPDGLAGIPERSRDGRVVRPLLRVTRAELLDFARARRLRWREDGSNASPAYARNRLRHHWLPRLREEFNPRLLRAIADLAEAQRRDAEWIADRVAHEAESRLSVEGAWLRIDAEDWERLPEALARRLARAALVRCGAERSVSRVHLTRMLEFLNAAPVGRRIELPGRLLLVCGRDGFRLGPLRGGLSRRLSC